MLYGGYLFKHQSILSMVSVGAAHKSIISNLVGIGVIVTSSGGVYFVPPSSPPSPSLPPSLPEGMLTKASFTMFRSVFVTSCSFLNKTS